MRGRMGGMRLLLQGALGLVSYGDANRTSYESPPTPTLGFSVWWLIGVPLVFIAVCWLILSIAGKGKASLWKDDDTKMDSGSFPDS